MKDYIARRSSEVEAVRCPCGSSKRLITRRDGAPVNIHITHIVSARKHYHENCTEFYYILEGWGRLEVEDDVIEVEPGLVVMIEKGTVHRGEGDFKALIIGVPAWDPKDEYIVD